ncbi:hypothetical protein Barb4_02464 [Bacteroidales bacterium Barb4]|nr:hypothetical protein Barb4_02464 [Bacteroidales bacterium Barb4]
MAAVHFAGNGACSGEGADVGHLRQRYFGSRSGSEHEAAYFLRRVAIRLVVAAYHVIHLAADKNLRNGFAANGYFNQFRHVRHVQSVASYLVAVGGDLQLRQRRLLFDGYVGGAFYLPDDGGCFFGYAACFAQVFAIDFHG